MVCSVIKVGETADCFVEREITVDYSKDVHRGEVVVREKEIIYLDSHPLDGSKRDFIVSDLRVHNYSDV